MMLQSRIARLEQRHHGNPLAALTDEELEAAIQTLKAQIEIDAGMTVEAYAEKLEQDVRDGKPSPLDAASTHAFIAAMKKDFRQAHDQLYRGT